MGYSGCLPLDNNLLEVFSEIVLPEIKQIAEGVTNKNWDTQRNKEAQIQDFMLKLGLSRLTSDFVKDADHPRKWN